MAVVGWQIYGKSGFLMCNSTQNVQFWKVCAVLVNKTVQFEEFTIQWPNGARKKMAVVGWQIYGKSGF